MKVFKATLIGSLISIFIVGYGFMHSPNSAYAAPYWAQCDGGQEIVHCETFNCPYGDTNSDGICNPSDREASVSDMRNDAFCGRPISGCGAIHYYHKNGGLSCSVYVIADTQSCMINARPVQNTTVRPAAVLAARSTVDLDPVEKETSGTSVIGKVFSVILLVGMIGVLGFSATLLKKRMPTLTQYTG